MPGLNRHRTAQIVIDCTRICHNFIRHHMSLDGKTPTHIAGLDLQPEGIIWKRSIKKAYKERQDSRASGKEDAVKR
jgi:hypothetical protein